MTLLKKIYLYLTVFFVGVAVLVVEILGTRLLAPFFGSTIFVWSSLIMVTLGALAAGYWVGGKLIDRRPHPRFLFGSIAIAGAFVFLPTKVDQWVLPHIDALGIVWGPLAASAALFALPLFFLGMVTPMVIRLLARDVEHSGSLAGSVFAVATLGSIVGALLAGFFLLPFLPLTNIFSLTGGALLALALAGELVVGKKIISYGSAGLVLFTAAALGAQYQLPAYVYEDTYTYQLHHQEQGPYGDLKVMEVGGSYCLALNGFTQSCRSTYGSTFGYVHDMADIMSSTYEAAGRPSSFRVLLLGAGAGDLLKALPSGVVVDAIDIDPRVVALAYEYFDLEHSPAHTIIISDARRFLRHTNERYDVILFDAYAGGQVPAHLVTREALALAAERLKPGGLFLLNAVARASEDDRLLMSLHKTLGEVFERVVMATADPANSELLQGVLIAATNGGDPSRHFSPETLHYEPASFAQGVVLTDDYAPVEFLSDTAVRFRDMMKNFGGYRLLFST